jgi:hypothetical protein
MGMAQDTLRSTVNPVLTGLAETGLIARPTCGSPSLRAIYRRSGHRPRQHGQVAQLVEQRTENPRVGGSIPPLATILFRHLRRPITPCGAALSY